MNPNFTLDGTPIIWEDDGSRHPDWTSSGVYHDALDTLPVPSDLICHWKDLQGWNAGKKALVCPVCRLIFGGRLAGVWDSFRAHLAEHNKTKGKASKDA